jgi:hypothetical protein
MSQKRHIARFDEINQLVERMQQHYEDLEGKPAAPAAHTDSVERVSHAGVNSTTGQSGPQTLHKALSDNLKFGPLNPARLARNTKKKAAVVEAEERTDFGALEGDDALADDVVAPHDEIATTTSADPREASLNEPLHGVRVERVYKEAVRVIEEDVRPNALNPTTRGAVDELSSRPAADHVPAGPETPAEAAPPFDPDATNANFQYEEGGWYVERYAKGAEHHSGEGAPYIDKGRTATFVVRPKKK